MPTIPSRVLLDLLGIKVRLNLMQLSNVTYLNVIIYLLFIIIIIIIIIVVVVVVVIIIIVVVVVVVIIITVRCLAKAMTGQF